MATYAQFRKLFYGDNELRRSYWVCGPDRVLVEEVVDAIRDRVAPSDLDYVTFTAGASPKDREIWDALHAYPVSTPDGSDRRLVVVRDAERMKKPERLADWVMERHLPRNYAIFVSNNDEEDTDLPHIERIRLSGRYVKCGPLNADDAVDWLVSKGPIQPHVARHLLQRVGHDLGDAADVMRKASYFNGQIDQRVVDFLCSRAPSDNFAELLCRMKKGEAADAIPAIDPDDYGRIVGLLDSRLDMLGRLNKAMRYEQNIRDLLTTTRIPGFLVRDMKEYARYYDRARVQRCTQALAFTDGRLADGERDGILEVLCALW